MATRPNPTQTKGTDEREARRAYQSWLRPPYTIDAQELERQLDEGSTDNGARATRRAALEEWQQANAARYTLSAAQLDELDRFVEDKGPRPGFVHPAGDGPGHTTDEKAASALRAAERIAREVKELPGEPGRYVEPSGPFALPGAPRFYPDPR